MSGIKVEDGSLVSSKWLAGLCSTLAVALIIWLAGALMNARDQLPQVQRDLAMLDLRISNEAAARDRASAGNIARRDTQVTELRADLRAVEKDQGAIRGEMTDRLARIEESQKQIAASIEEIKRQLAGSYGGRR